MIPAGSERVPPVLRSLQARKARAAAKEFFSRPASKRGQASFRFDDELLDHPELKEGLYRLFRGKCAYCERVLTRDLPLHVEHFRPRSGAMGLGGSVDLDHYWWLVYDWRNLLPACADCVRQKGARFPVAGRRARAGSAAKEEKALLLDPRTEAVTEHLAYLDDGHVVGRDDRANTTIDVLGLNRRQLLLARAAALTRLHAEWLKSKEQPRTEDVLDPALPFAGMRAQFVTQWQRDTRAMPRVSAEVGTAQALEVTAEEKVDLRSSYDARQEEKESYSVVRDLTDYFTETRLLRRVSVRNLRVVKELDLELGEPATTGAPWLMLLGENGTGKSSLLEAIALALTGDALRNRLPVDPAGLLRSRTQKGYVEVELTSGPPIRLEFSKKGFKSSDPEPKVLLLGYGPTRLLPTDKKRSDQPLGTQFARVDNLFDPFVPLGDATRWILGLPKAEFTAVARGLTQILALEDVDARIVRNRRAGRIEVEMFGGRVPLEHLSEGYQSVLALAADLMSVMLFRWQTMEAAEGIVVIDELGAHLHPRWRMRIVPALRSVFPRVQFVASTHDPLCLRGMLNGEVAVLRRSPAGGVFAASDLPPVEGLRVDQLLTSEHFGLNSTIDPELDALFARYYELKAEDKLAGPERKELAALKNELEGRRVLGRTRRERLMLEAVDDYLATELQPVSGKARRVLRASTKRRVAELWREAKPITTVPPA